MKKVMIIFGTRPDAIKMCPLVLEMKKHKKIDLRVCVTGQHKQMLQQVLDIFDVVPDYYLHVMKDNQTPFDITIRALSGLEPILKDFLPDIVLVHGDTTTGFVASLAAFYQKIAVGHVEAGLRTHNIYSPFPEEFNRQAITIVSQYYFAPTQLAAYNLIRENHQEDRIYITGNTAIDALKYTIKNDYISDELKWVGRNRFLIVTAHRRENFGEPMQNMLQGVRDVLDKYDNLKAVLPVHLNPHTQKVANEVFKDCKDILLTKPMNVIEFHNLMARSHIILTDSGGIQEEAPSLGKPVLVMRDNTERPEGVRAGTLKLTGTNRENIFNACCELLDNEDEYHRVSMIKNPYGDGHASERIAEIVEN